MPDEPLLSLQPQQFTAPAHCERRYSVVLRPLFRLAMLLLFVLPVATLAGQQFTVAPPPAWVSPATLPPAGDSRYLLIDRQTRVNGTGVERYTRKAYVVLSASSLEDSSELRFDFEPSFQKLIIHYISIRRGDQLIDALRPREIRVLQQEEEKEQRIYNGTLSAVALLNDVRVGDVIDFAYSINGENPILGGRYADTMTLCARDPVAHLRFRLLWPAGRMLHFKNQQTDLQPVIHELGQEREYLWERRQVPALDDEDKTPDWFNPAPQVQLSEFANWQAVAEWAWPLYQAPRPLSAELKKQLDRWRGEHPQPESRFIAALRFVQDEVRYLGIELGPHSHQPHDPSEVFAKRFGDCKDKSLLLSSILKGLEIEAAPALVNTSARETIDRWQPSPFSFDHVIVRVKLDGKVYWVDATASLQRGGVQQLYNPAFARALVIGNDTRELETIPPTASDQPRTVVKEIYRAESYDRPATLEVVTTYYGAEADEMRPSLARERIEELGKTWLNFYARTDPGVVADGLPQIRDDPQANVIVITEKYRIPDFWRDQSRYFYPESVYTELQKPKISKRSQPLAVTHPMHILHTTEVHLPPGYNFDADSGSEHDAAMSLDYKSDFAGNTLRLEYRLRSLSDHVPADKIARHVEALDRMQQAVRFRLARGGEAADEVSALAALGVLALVFGPLVVFGTWRFWQARKAGLRRGEFKLRQRAATGSTPDTAIRIPAGDDLTLHLPNHRCACGNPFPWPDARHEETAIFDGRRLTVVQLACERCSRQQALYFERQTPHVESRLPDYGQARQD
ncbi:MAG TPA: DUF3857 domain-containing protein [Blastocatellia bacterium]|nr:DUF3857 domain-containing protein [Blastocatellia bacterium]